MAWFIPVLLVVFISALLFSRIVDTVKVNALVRKIVFRSGLLHILHRTPLPKFIKKKLYLKNRKPYLFQEIANIKLRDDDVFLITYPKSGTTWLQEIVWLLQNDVDINTALEVPNSTRVPFMDVVDEGPQKGIMAIKTWPKDKPRIIKTHEFPENLPNELKAGKKCKVIYIIRNPKDVMVSYYHYLQMSSARDDPGTWNEYFIKFCSAGFHIGDWFSHVTSHWKARDCRYHFLTYESLQRDARGEIVKVAKFLEKSPTEKELEDIIRHCSFKNMSTNSNTNRSTESSYKFDFTKSKFMRKGVSGDWKNFFTINQNAAFNELYSSRIDGSGVPVDFEM